MFPNRTFGAEIPEAQLLIGNRRHQLKKKSKTRNADNLLASRNFPDAKASS